MFIRGPGSSSHQRGRRFVVDSKYFLGPCAWFYTALLLHILLLQLLPFLSLRARGAPREGSFFTCCQSKGGTRSQRTQRRENTTVPLPKHTRIFAFSFGVFLKIVSSYISRDDYASRYPRLLLKSAFLSTAFKRDAFLFGKEGVFLGHFDVNHVNSDMFKM